MLDQRFISTAASMLTSTVMVAGQHDLIPLPNSSTRNTTNPLSKLNSEKFKSSAGLAPKRKHSSEAM